MEAIKDKKGFDPMKRPNKRSIHLTEQNQAEEKLTYSVNSVEIHMNHEDAQHMARDAHNVGKNSEARADRPP